MEHKPECCQVIVRLPVSYSSSLENSPDILKIHNKEEREAMLVTQPEREKGPEQRFCPALHPAA
jgi:hypothetical protein